MCTLANVKMSSEAAFAAGEPHSWTPRMIGGTRATTCPRAARKHILLIPSSQVAVLTIDLRFWGSTAPLCETNAEVARRPP